MKLCVRLFCLAAALVLVANGPASATVPVVFGTTWDGPGTTLQEIMDAAYGVGAVNCGTD